MRTTVYHPFSAFRRLQSDMNQAFAKAESDDKTREPAARWVPLVDVHEYADRFVISAEVAGIDPDQIEVTLDDGVLSISGKRESTVVADDEPSTHRSERIYGEFTRRFTLPETADPDSINAQVKHGVLELSIGKRAQLQPKRIEIAA